MAPSAGLVVWSSSKRIVIAPPSPPLAVGMFIVNDASADVASVPVVSIASIAVAAFVLSLFNGINFYINPN